MRSIVYTHISRLSRHACLRANPWPTQAVCRALRALEHIALRRRVCAVLQLPLRYTRTPMYSVLTAMCFLIGSTSNPPHASVAYSGAPSLYTATLKFRLVEYIQTPNTTSSSASGDPPLRPCRRHRRPPSTAGGASRCGWPWTATTAAAVNLHAYRG